ncbi:hypothetical protein K2173_003001 [Erythroxylum novogranatense]|uniref:Reduced epidermal fluorescence 4 n=1 Tax=Erythroxylum novogranatense TaxID=1862640 RepID=A0AAV8S8I0_9ROSI|nr:hypothetical protein K2173_003001 [Erythroxylum novogranatense]
MVLPAIQHSIQLSTWDSVLEVTVYAQNNNSDPMQWKAQVAAILSSSGVALPSTELAHLLVSHICFDNHVPITWKFLEKALTFNLVPSVLVIALLSVRVVPLRRLHCTAYRIYLELLERHGFSFASLVNGPNYEKIMKAVDGVLLSHIHGLQVCEPGILLAEFVFSIVCQLLDASLDDEGLLELTSEKIAVWLIRPQDMEIGCKDSFIEKGYVCHEGLDVLNTKMALELLGKFLQHKVTSRILSLARQNMTSHWEGLIQRFQLLTTHSVTLKNSTSMLTEAFLQFTTGPECKRVLNKKIHAVISSGALLPSPGQCYGVSQSELWLPIDLYIEDAMDRSDAAVNTIENLAGLIKSLRAINCTAWHDTLLSLWIAALRVVQREKDVVDCPLSNIESFLCMLLSITTIAIGYIIDEESAMVDKTKCNSAGQTNEKHDQENCQKGLITALQLLGDFEDLLTPPQAVRLLANQAAAKATVSLSGLPVHDSYYQNSSLDDIPVHCTGNLRHMIVEACIARNLLDTSAYLWPGYVNACINQVSHVASSQISGWSSFMNGSPLTPLLIKTLVTTPASSLTEIKKVYELAVSGSADEKMHAANILCGASLICGWNIQEYTILFILKLLESSIPADNFGSAGELIDYAPLLNVLLAKISSPECLQIITLHGLAPVLAGALMPICEIFGSSVPHMLGALPSEDVSCHEVFSNAFILLLRLWKFDRLPLEHLMGEVPAKGPPRSPEYLLLVRNSQLASHRTSPSHRLRWKRLSKVIHLSEDPLYLDSFPKLKSWYLHHRDCVTACFFDQANGSTVHQVVDALLHMMFRRINSDVQSSTSTTSGAIEDVYMKLKIPIWDILEATPIALHAALMACAHGRLSPRELATGLKYLADFLPACLATVVCYFSAEITRGIWRPALMNGIDWPSPANLPAVEQQIKKILGTAGLDVPNLSVVSLTITYKIDKESEKPLALFRTAFTAIAASCPWPCMPIVASLWALKVKRWSGLIVFYACQTVFHHNWDAVAQLLQSCFAATLGLSPNISSYGGMGALLGHGYGSPFIDIAPGILFLRFYRSIKDVMSISQEILSILVHSVKDLATSGVPREAVSNLKKTNHVQVSLASTVSQVKLAASLGASMVWICGGSTLVQSLIKVIISCWLISAQASEHEDLEYGGMCSTVSVLKGYALAYLVLLSGTLAWGVDSASPSSKDRPEVLGIHLEFLASTLDGKASLGGDWGIARAYVCELVSLMVACTPAWIVELDADVLKRLSKLLILWNEEELALAMLGRGGVACMGAATELIIQTEIKAD